MSHVEQLKKPGLDTFFGYAEAVIDAMQAGRYTTDTVPDSKAHNRGSIVMEPAMNLSDGPDSARIQDVAALISMLALKQLNVPDGDARIGKEFEFAATRYENKGCFYFVLPEGRSFDYLRLRRDLREAREMMRKTDAPVPNPLSPTMKASAYWMGPFNPEDMRFTRDMFGRLLNFHGIDALPSKPFVDEAGQGYVACKMADMALLLQKEQLQGLTVARAN